MYVSTIALALAATTLAAPVHRRQGQGLVGTTITGTQDGIDNISDQIEGVTDQLTNTDNPSSALSTVNDITLENTNDVLTSLLGGS